MAKLPDHRGKATWGEKLVPLGTFREAVEKQGRTLGVDEREAAIRDYLGTRVERPELEGPYERIAVFGGVYGNHRALEVLLTDAERRGAEALFCLGDLGGFGPNPEKVRPLLEQGSVRCIQGNYEQSLAAGEQDCNCGYTDPRDNYFAEISYAYTAKSCSPEYKTWMGGLPQERRVGLGGLTLQLVHGSPRRVNEFLFHSTSPVAFLERQLDRLDCDGFLCTHTGLHWHRRLPSGRDVANVGVIGRPANDGRTEVWYSLLEWRDGTLDVEFVPLAYDHRGLADEMRRECLPPEFCETILTGWWTTCLEILPAKERAASRF